MARRLQRRAALPFECKGDVRLGASAPQAFTGPRFCPPGTSDVRARYDRLRWPGRAHIETHQSCHEKHHEQQRRQKQEARAGTAACALDIADRKRPHEAAQIADRIEHGNRNRCARTATKQIRQSPDRGARTRAGRRSAHRALLCPAPATDRACPRAHRRVGSRWDCPLGAVASTTRGRPFARGLPRLSARLHADGEQRLCSDPEQSCSTPLTLSLTASGPWCVPLRTASSGHTVGNRRLHGGCGLYLILRTPRVCALASG